MALTKQEVTDKIEILEDGVVQIRRATRIFDDGVLVSETFKRAVLEPGQNIAAESGRVRQVCAAVWTPQVVADYQEKVAEFLKRQTAAARAAVPAGS